MTTTNKRTHKIFNIMVNGVAVGGTTMLSLTKSYAQNLTTPADGLQLPLRDRFVQQCSGSLTTHDWSLYSSLLTGAVGTLTGYERNSGVAEATGYTKHTVTNPIFNRFALNFKKNQYATLAADFQCKAADDTKGFLDAHTAQSGQEKPDHQAAGYGGFKLKSLSHGGSASLKHVQSLTLDIAIPLLTASDDGDIGYTLVEQDLSNIMPTGSVTVQDTQIGTSNLVADDFLEADADDLELTVAQGSGGSDKVLTISGVQFSGDTINWSNNGFNSVTLPFYISNDPDDVITLATLIEIT